MIMKKNLEYDEHICLSLKNAQMLCEYISEHLCEIDETNKEIDTLI